MKVETRPGHLLIVLDNEAETQRLGQVLASVVRPGTVIGLSGEMGAGKTRLTRALAESLGVDPGAISSPTFVLVHEYAGSLPVFHFDTYRLESADDFERLGVHEYFQAGGVCVVEWADRVLELLPGDAWLLRLEHDPVDPERRTVRLDLPDPRLAEQVASGLRGEAD